MAKESKTGLWATAGTSLVGLVAASIYGWLTPLWTWLSELAAGLWAHLRASTAMPNWSIYLLGAVVCGALLTFNTDRTRFFAEKSLLSDPEAVCLQSGSD